MRKQRQAQIPTADIATAEKYILQVTAEIRQFDSNFHEQLAYADFPAYLELLEKYCVQRFDLFADRPVLMSHSASGPINPMYEEYLRVAEEKTSASLSTILQPLRSDLRDDILSRIALRLGARKLWWLAEAKRSLLATRAAGSKAPKSAKDTYSPSVGAKVEAINSWQELEIAFLSDDRVEICTGGKRETFNYDELGFSDRRNNVPNRAWTMLREMAKLNGGMPRPEPGKPRAMFQKRMQEIRKKLRGRFKIDADPIPFNGDSYRASFKIGRRRAFDT